MRTALALFMLLVMGIGTLTFGAASARAEEISCSGRLGAVTVDNVKVPRGKTCTMSGTRVKGNIWISSGATLKATSINVIGNIQSEGFSRLQISGTSKVGGSIQLKNGGTFVIDSVAVKGNIQVDENTGASKIARNQVNGDIQVFENDGRVSIGSNRIDGNLQCKSNSPAPTGSGNVVGGSKEDQCRRL